MKRTTYLLSAATATVCMLTSLPASGQNVDWQPGDLLLGFQTTGSGSTNTVVFNIGSFVNYRDAAMGSSFLVPITGLDAVLDATFGNDWNTRSDVYWGIAGAALTTSPGAPTFTPPLNGDPARTFYATRPQSPLGTPASPFVVGNGTDQAGIAGDMYAFQTNAFDGRAAAAGTGGMGTVIPTSVANGWEDYNTLTPPVGSFGVLPSIQGNFGNGTAGTALDLFRVLSTASNANPTGPQYNGTYEGTFTINDSGAVSFAVVPEPTSAALASLGALAMLGRRRRQVTKVTA